MIRYTAAHELRRPNGNGCLGTHLVYDLAHNSRHRHPGIAQASINKADENPIKCKACIMEKALS